MGALLIKKVMASRKMLIRMGRERVVLHKLIDDKLKYANHNTMACSVGGEMPSTRASVDKATGW